MSDEKTKQQREDEPFLPWLTRRRGRVLTLVFTAVLFLALALWLDTVTTPIAMALVIAYVLDPLINWLQGKGMKRVYAVSLVFATVLVLLLVVLLMVIPPAIAQVQKLPGWLEQQSRAVAERVGTIGAEDADLTPPAEEPAAEADTALAVSEDTGAVPAASPVGEGPDSPVQEDAGAREDTGTQGGLLDQIKTRARANAGTIAARVLSVMRRIGEHLVGAAAQVVGVIVQIVLVFIYTFFFMLGLEKARTSLKRYLPAAYREDILRVWGRLDNAYANFFRGRGTICLISGVLTSVGLLIVGVPFWLLIGMSVGLLGIIPFIGVTMGLIPAVLLGYASGGLGSIVGVLIVFALVQSIEPLLTPIILSKGTKLHPVTVLIALLAGGSMFGLLGAIISVPLASTVKILLEEFVLPPLRAFAGEDESAAAEDA